MLIHTFRHLPGIGIARERAIWSSGCKSWYDVEKLPSVFESCGIPKRSADDNKQIVATDLAAFERGDVSYLTGRFSSKYHWRFYRYFPDKTAFLDIETTGTDPESTLVTVIGLHSAEEGHRVFIDGLNLDEFPSVVSSYDFLTTFNGTSFDLPILRRAFRDLVLPVGHIDLRWLCREVKLWGGLKEVEKKIGIARHPSVSSFNGVEAVNLWRNHLSGKREALNLLVRYNLEDTVNLHKVLLHCLTEMNSKYAFLGLEPYEERPWEADFIDVERAIERAFASR